jgi:AcrR family transcriptional regulator
MRDLAQASGLSPGAFYYHFPSKESVIQVFYETTFNEFEAVCRELFAQTDSFGQRLEQAMVARIDSFRARRPLLMVLARSAVDPHSDLSPFGSATKELRIRSVKLFREMIEGSDFKSNSELRQYVPALIWMYLMGIILYWVFDESKEQAKTHRLIYLMTPQLVQIMRFSHLPLIGPLINPLIESLDLLMPKNMRRA